MTTATSCARTATPRTAGRWSAAARCYPLEELARLEVARAGGPPSDVPGTLHNLRVADDLGQLLRFVDADGALVGFISWVRLTRERLRAVEFHQLRCFDRSDNVRGAPVCFVVEQMNSRGYSELSRRLRLLTVLPGVEVIGGWQGARLHIYPTRAYRFFARAV